MHDTQHPTSDDAAAAIRDASPTPDAAATERIAQLIADGAPSATPAVFATRPTSRRVSRGPFGLLRPALAVGAVAVAGAVALLAPGSDPSAPDRGLLALGPDAAAAQVLEIAGDAIDQPDWTALTAGEFHYTRSVDYSEVGRTTTTVERWLAADGTLRIRHTEAPTWLEPGDEVYTLANTCLTAHEAFTPRIGEPIAGYETVPVGTALPKCWDNSPVNPLLATASGEIVDAPPVGAFVELPVTLPGAVGGELRFGDRVLESDRPSSRPPGNAAPVDAGEPVDFEPFRFRTTTSWVRIDPQPRVRFDDLYRPDEPSATRLSQTWERAFTIDELAGLPTEATELAPRLEQAARAVRGTYMPMFGAGMFVRALPGDARLDQRSTVHALTLELLASAPISPGTRRAAFDVLATQTNEQGSPAVVETDAKLPTGEPAVGVSFSLAPAEGYEYPGGEDDAVTMLFDRETAAFLAIDMRLGGAHSITAYDTPKRVTSMPPVDAD